MRSSQGRCSAARRIGAVVVGLLLVACGGGTEAKGPPSTATLRAALLTASDVGANWQAGHAINDQDLAAFAQTPCESATISPAVVKRLTAVTGAQFEPVDRSSRHLIELVVTGDAAQLDADLRALFAAVESCAPGTSTSVRVATLAIPQLGEQQAAYVFTARMKGATTTVLVRSGYVRMGSVAVLLGLTDFQASAQGVSQVSDNAYRALLEEATTKLRDA